MTKILLLGASGQLGREWQKYLVHREEEGLLVIPYTSSQLDIAQFKEVEHELRKQQPAVLINCAAYTNVDEAEENREQATKINAGAVLNLAAVCNSLDIKLVHFSTDYVFAGRKEDQHHFPEGYPENHPADPINWYGHTKWEGEQAIRESGCPHLIMRISWLCGAYGNNFVKTMLRLAENRDEIDVVEDQMGSPTFAHNLVKNTFKLVEGNKKGTYHFTSEGMISWADFAEAIFSLAQKQVQVNRISSSEYDTKAARPFFSKLDTAKVAQIAGMEIEPWKRGLKHLLKTING